MILQKYTDRDKFYQDYYTILNSSLKLTNTEIKVLSEFMKIRSSLGEFQGDEKDRLTFSATSRQIVCSKLDITKYSLNNYVKGLKEKNMLISVEQGYKLNPYLDITPQEEIVITFKILLK